MGGYYKIENEFESISDELFEIGNVIGNWSNIEFESEFYRGNVYIFVFF